jgi:ElaB/YqjD/DUF883 family membrane-anchored ribosome-binding protein
MAAGEGTVEAVRERLAPALDTLDDRLRHGRRMVVRGQHAAEDAAAAAALIVRRRPLGAVVVAAGVAAVIAGAIGFAAGWLTRHGAGRAMRRHYFEDGGADK